MNLQDKHLDSNEGIAFRAISVTLLLTATALLVGSLVTAHSVNPSPNSGWVTTGKQI